MSKITVYDASTGKYEIVEVGDTPIIEDKQIEQPKTEIELLREENQQLKKDVEVMQEALQDLILMTLGGE